MSCPHSTADIILSKDKEYVYEICSICNKLIVMESFSLRYDKKPYYIMPSLNFKDLFELKNEGLYYKSLQRTIYPDKNINAPSRHYYNKFVPVREKKPMFFTNMKEYKDDDKSISRII